MIKAEERTVTIEGTAMDILVELGLAIKAVKSTLENEFDGDYARKAILATYLVATGDEEEK